MQQPALPQDGASWIGLLRCPDCCDQLALQTVATPRHGRGVWGTLTCPCSSYPVIDDIPILLPDRVASNSTGDPVILDPGPSVAELVALVTGPEPMRALASLVQLSPLPWPLGRASPIRRLHDAQATKRALRRSSRRRLRRMLAAREQLTAEDWLAALYLRGAHRNDNYSYFMYRFSQPRQLAFLSLLETVPDGLLLDIGCGLGHLSWLASNDGRDVIGVDYNFSQLWVARWYMAPAARFVCADATRTLPFEDGVAAASMFADGIHIIPNVELLLAQLHRCARNGTVFLPRFGNANVLPEEGFEVSVPEWQRRFDALGPHRLFAEAGLIEGYLRGQAADLTASDDPEQLRTSKWLHAVISDDPTLFVDHGKLGSPAPHARGTLQINPIYTHVGPDERRLRLSIPSDWYAFEDGELTRYHAYQVAMTPEQIAHLGSQDPLGILADLVDQFVVIGLPDSYYRSGKRRFKPRAYQVATALRPKLVDIPDARTYPPSIAPLASHKSRGPTSN